MSSEDKDTTLAKEAKAWANGELDPREWEDAPEAVPRSGESVSISIRIPKKMLLILKEFARREGVGYQVLMKQWLDERIREEATRIRRERRQIRLVQPQVLKRAASFGGVSDSEIVEQGGSDALG